MLRQAQVRLRRSIAISDEATQKSFARFVDTAVGLVTLAASLVGGPSGTLLRVIVAKVGTKLVLLGPDYTATAFVEDVASEATGVIGGQVAVGLLAKGIPGIAAAARRTKLPLNPEITALAGKGARWAVDQIGSSLGSQVPGVILDDKGFHFPTAEEFVTALGITGAHHAKTRLTAGKRSTRVSSATGRPVDPTTAKADREIGALGKLDKAGETREYLRKNDALRLNLIKNPLANRVLKRCASLCYPQELKDRPDLVRTVEVTLAPLKRRNALDESATSLFLYERRGNIARAVEQLEGIAQGAQRNRGFFNDAVRRANRNEPVEIAQLGGAGQGVRARPATEAELAASNQRVADANTILQNPNASAQQQTAAMQAVLTRAVAEYRLIRERELVGLGREPVLTGDNLHQCCGQGRDVTVDAVAAMTIGSRIPVTVDRYRAQDFGFGAAHTFAVIRTPDGQAFIVDPTFGQFADRIARPADYTVADMVATPDGRRVAADLLRDGFVPLNRRHAELYMRGLGATEAQAAVAARGVVARNQGNRAVIRETVRNGEIVSDPQRPKAGNDDVLPRMGREGSLALIQGLINQLPAGDLRRRMLEDLRRRLAALPGDKPQP